MLNHPEVFLGVSCFFVMYLIVFRKIKTLLNKKQTQFKRNPVKYMFMFPIAWIVGILFCIAFSAIVWVLTWVTQALVDNPVVHDYGLFLIQGLYFSMPKWRYVWVISTCTIALFIVNIFPCLTTKKKLTFQEAQASLSTKQLNDGSWTWVMKGGGVGGGKRSTTITTTYVSGNPTVNKKRRKVIVKLSSNTNVNVLALVNLLFVIFIFLIIVIWVQFIPPMSIQEA